MRLVDRRMLRDLWSGLVRGALLIGVMLVTLGVTGAMGAHEDFKAMPDDVETMRLAEVLGSITLAKGDRADLIRELAPTGEIVVHQRIVTSTYVDKLYADRLLCPHDAGKNANMRDAAQKLLHDWLQAEVAVGQVQSSVMDRCRVQGAFAHETSIGDEEAFQRYCDALASLTKLDANVARRAIIDEQPVQIEPLRAALSGLVRHYLRG